MPRFVDKLQLVQVMEYLRGSRLRNTGLGRQRSRPGFLILSAAKAYERADDSKAARAARQSLPLGRWSGRGTPLTKQQPSCAELKVSLGIGPRPAISGQDRPERFGDERSDYQRMPAPG